MLADADSTLLDMLYRLDNARRDLAPYDAYYEGEQPIRFIAPALQKEFGDRICALVLNWPRMVADAFESRLDVMGFRYAGDSSADSDLWDVWQANNLDEQSQQGHLETVALSRAYAITGAADTAGDPPVVTMESPMQVFARRDPRTRKVIRAVKRWDDYALAADGLWIPEVQHAVLYEPGIRQSYVNVPKAGQTGWRTEGDPAVYDDAFMPVTPLINHPRILRPDGRSEFVDIIGVADAANKMSTDMMVSGEYHAMPRRWAAGIQEKDFVDEAGNPLNPWSRDAGTLWATENAEAKFGQFNESDLAVFHNTVRMLSQLVVQLAGLPPYYAMAPGSDANPASAEAIEAAESRFVKNCERKQTYLGGAWEDVQRNVLRLLTGRWDRRAWTLETIWRDASTPTRAQMADAALKLATPIQGGRAIVPIEQAREDLGYTPEQRRRMAEMDAQAAADPSLERLVSSLTTPPPAASGASA